MARRPAPDLLHGELTSSIIGSMYEVRQELGYGYREYIYARALESVLIAKGHRVRREVAAWVYFRGKPLAKQVFDMVVDDTVIVEIKSTERLPESATNQLFGYLAGTDFEVGLLLHFGQEARAYLNRSFLLFVVPVDSSRLSRVRFHEPSRPTDFRRPPRSLP